ncbi:high mobility group box domain-containing protein, partial [Tanacetum coccineum]
QKMKEMTELPFDILNLIFILLATSTNGARDLVRISKTCKMLNEHAEQTSLLRVVSFQGLTDDYIKHLHPRDLIFRCAQVGNQGAECILGKVFLTDLAYRHTISSNDQPTRDENGSYFLSFVGFEKYNAIGMFGAVRNMFSYKLKRFDDTTECLGSPSPNNFLAQVMPPHDAAHREAVIVKLDSLFPLNHVEEFRKTFKKENPTVKAVSAVGKAGGEKWKSLSAAEKAPYEAKAAKRKTDYEKLMTAYNKKQDAAEDDEESDKSKSEVDEESGQDGGDDEEDEEEDEDDE